MKGMRMSVLEGIMVDLSIVLGSAHVPIRQLLQMSRGAMVPLACGQDDPTLVFVNDELVAKGRAEPPRPLPLPNFARLVQRLPEEPAQRRREPFRPGPRTRWNRAAVRD